MLSDKQTEKHVKNLLAVVTSTTVFSDKQGNVYKIRIQLTRTDGIEIDKKDGDFRVRHVINNTVFDTYRPYPNPEKVIKFASPFFKK